jgi:tetratricopeptide (TPR) repeat protein
MKKDTLTKASRHRPDTARTAGVSPRQTTTIFWFDSLRPYALAIALIGVVLVLYGRTVTFGYTGFDDESLVRDNVPLLSDATKILRLFQSDVSLGNYSPRFYRPFQMLSYMFDTLIGNAHTSAYHAMNIVLHCAVCCTLLYLFLFLGIKKRLAFLAALLYGVHPLFVQSVAWIPSRGDLLIALFLPLSFIAFVKYYRESKWTFLLLHEILFLFAVFSKETAVVFPVLLCAYAYLFLAPKIEFRKLLVAAIPWAAILGFWFVLRSAAIQKAIDSNIAGVPAFVHNLPALPELISKFAVPIGIFPMPIFTTMGAIVGLLVLAGLLALAIVRKKNMDPLFLFGLLWFFLFLAPGLWYRHEIGRNAYDYLSHRMYLPAVGLIAAILALFTGTALEKRRTAFISGVVLIVLLGLSSMTLCAHYSDIDSFFQYAIDGNPDSAMAFSERGIARYVKGDLDNALADFNEAIRILPTYGVVYNNRGCMFLSAGEYLKAIDDFNRVLSLDTADAEAYMNRGTAYYKMKNYPAAERDLSSAIGWKPEYGAAFLLRGVARNDQGNHQGAMTDFQEAYRINPNSVEVFLYRARMYRGLKQWPNAIADYQKAVQLQPDNVEAYIGLANVAADQGDVEGALKFFTRAIEAKPTSVDPYMNRGLFKYARHDFHGAIADLTDAIRVDPSSAEAYSNRGVVYNAMGEVQKSLSDLSEAIRLKPMFVDALRNRGILRLQVQDKAGAMEDWTRAMELGDAHAAALLKDYGQ